MDIRLQPGRETVVNVSSAALQRIPYQLGLVGLAALVAALSMLFRGLDPSVSPNIATNARITASGQQAPHDHVNGLVDGDIWHIGFQTLSAPDSWILLDLGQSKLISSVVIYNRTDCCQADAVPLTIELGPDEHTFQVVARNGDAFEKWNASFLPRQGRFLRVQLHRTGPLCLNEIEVR